MSPTAKPDLAHLRTPNWLYIAAGASWGFALLVFWARQKLVPWVHSDGSVNADDWLGFTGSILGAILGGLAAVLVLRLTLRHERSLESLRQRVAVADRRTKYAEQLNKTLGNVYMKFDTNSGELPSALFEASNLAVLIENTWSVEAVMPRRGRRLGHMGTREMRNRLWVSKFDLVALKISLAFKMLTTVIGEQAIDRPRQAMNQDELYTAISLGQKLTVEIIAISNKPELEKADLDKITKKAESLREYTQAHLKPESQ